MQDTKSIKLKIISAGYKAVEELIKVAEDGIIGSIDSNDELSADKLKNAAQAKKLAIFDAFEILNRIESEKENIEMLEKGSSKVDSKQGFAERRSK
jgi:hypothetical protein